MEEENIVFNKEQIKEIIQHREPFLFVDRVIEFNDSESIVAIKEVKAEEDYFKGHFPGNPVMPGVIIMEALAQTSAILALKSTQGAGEGVGIYLVGCKNFKWKKMVKPGDTLRLEVKFVNNKKSLWIIESKALVDGQVVASGTISAISES